MLYSKRIQSINDAVVKQKDRNFTDVICGIIGLVFAIFMFIMALVLMKKDNYYKSNFPTDSESIPCGYGKNQQFPMVYFPDINDRNIRVCVSVCPNKGDSELICRPNSKVSSCKIPNIYQTSQDFERLGGFCAPIDDGAKQKLIDKAGLHDKWSFLNTYDTIRLSLLISLGIGIVWLILVQLTQGIMAVISPILAGLVAIGVAVFLLIDNAGGFEGKQWIRLTAAIIMGCLGLFVLIQFILYKRRTTLMRFFLKFATSWAKEKIIFIIWIPIYIVLSLGLIVLIFFQHLAFISKNDPQPAENDIYLKLQPSVVLEIFNIIEFLWGLQFLKDSFNFIISGSASQYYLGAQNGLCLTFTRLIKHFGSVVGGSFLNAFFNWVIFIMESLRCYPQGKCNLFASCCNCIFDDCIRLISLVRTDVYTYINLTAIPYCNACRNCEVANGHIHTKQHTGSQSSEFFYRNCSYITCVGISFIICYLIEKSKLNNYVNIQSLFVIILLSYCILAYFIDFHADAAEGIQVTSLVERYFGNSISNRIHDNQKRELQNIINNQQIQDGGC